MYILERVLFKTRSRENLNHIKSVRNKEEGTIGKKNQHLIHYGKGDEERDICYIFCYI